MSSEFFKCLTSSRSGERLDEIYGQRAVELIGIYSTEARAFTSVLYRMVSFAPHLGPSGILGGDPPACGTGHTLGKVWTSVLVQACPH